MKHERIRNLLYRAIQNVRHEPVFQVLESLEESQWYPIQKHFETQTNKLENLLQFAETSVPFYSGKIGGITKVWNDFKKIEPVKKEDLRDRRSEMISTGKKGKFTVAKTAGSGGIPLTLPISNISWAYHHANLLRILKWHDIRPLEKQGRIWGRGVDAELRTKTYLKDIVFNRIRLSVFDFTADSCRRFYNRLRKLGIRYLYGYASGLVEFGRVLMRLNLSGTDLGLNGIFSTAENLAEESRYFIEDWFGCKAVNIYGAAEVGIIAGECPYGKMHIPIESIIVETGTNSGGSDIMKPILVTDLHNYKMPIIRYELGDLITLAENPMCRCGRTLPILDKIWGRARGFFEIDGKLINPALFNFVMKNVFLSPGRIRQYQVIRDGERHFSLYLSTDIAPTKAEIGNFEDLLKANISKDLKISIFVVPEIRRNKRSGKAEIFLDEYTEIQN